MTDVRRIHPSHHGRILYDSSKVPRDLDHFRGRRQRPHVLRISGVNDEFSLPSSVRNQKKKERREKKEKKDQKDQKDKQARPSLQRSGKSSDQAKRFIRLISPFKTKDKLSSELVRQPSFPGLIQVPGQLSTSTLEPPEIVRQASQFSHSDSSSFEENMRMAAASPRNSVAGGAVAPPPRTLLTEGMRNDSTGSTGSSPSRPSNAGLDSSAFVGQKPVATGNGVAVFVTMAEPVIYLSGFENHDPSTRSTAMLRGNMLLRISKTAKIKTVSMKFKGRAETDWPEGIPPKRTEFKDTYNIIDHTFSFYDCNMGNSEHHGAHTFIPVKVPGASQDNETPIPATALEHLRKSSVFESITSTKERRHSLQSTHSRGVVKTEIIPSPAHKGYRTFTPGDYIYNFELPIDSRYPESIDVELGYVKYELEACIERAGAFRANLIGSKEVQLVRAPSGESLESVEPIAISRDWEDQLHYDIVISGKSFPLGSQVPIAFKLTPLAKVQCHRVKVFITENIQYFTKDKKVHRMEPTRKLQLFEKRADSPSNSTFEGSSIRIISGGGVSYDDRERAARGEEDIRRDNTNLLGRLEEEFNVGPTEMELNVQLPSCFNMPEKDKNQRIHFDTTYSNIQVHHWIKIVMRLSKADPENPGKRRHFEISIDSPLNILSCRAAQTNISLPSYSSPDASLSHLDHSVCGCPGAPQRRLTSTLMPRAPPPQSGSSSRTSPSASSMDLAAGLAPPPAAHLAGSSTASSASSSSHDLSNAGDAYDIRRDTNRPMLLLRQPSFNPPSFDDSDPPPPLVTPPPRYESLVGPGDDPDRGLADYFQRLADEIDESDDGARWANRLEIPLTPGGRVNRSMDEIRSWRPVVG